MGDVPMVRNPMLGNASAREIPPAPPPLLGEHTGEVLADIAQTA